MRITTRVDREVMVVNTVDTVGTTSSSRQRMGGGLGVREPEGWISDIQR